MTEQEFLEKYPAEIGAIWTELRAKMKGFGIVSVEVKKSSLHVVNKKGFAGIHPKQSYLGLNVVLSRSSTAPAADSVEQVSANRFHHLFKLRSKREITPGLLKLLREAHELMR